MEPSLLSPDEFPNSKQEPFIVTSPSSGYYNCIAWAIESQHFFYWPSSTPNSETYFNWPPNLPRRASIKTFHLFFESFGFEPCEDGALEPGFQKIALFAKEMEPTHAARQLPDGWCTSKIGAWVDVRHTLPAMEGGMHGDVVQFFRRKI